MQLGVVGHAIDPGAPDDAQPSAGQDANGMGMIATTGTRGGVDAASPEIGMARLDADGRQVAGDRASKTITLHRRIYAATAASHRPAGSVIHTHSTSLVACSLKAFEANGRLDGEAELLPPITPYFVMRSAAFRTFPTDAPVRTRPPRRWRRPLRAMLPTAGNSVP